MGFCIEDGARGGEREGEWFLNEDVLARVEGGDGVGGVELVGGEDEDDVDRRVGKEVGRRGGVMGDVELGGAVRGGEGRDVADGGESEEGGEERQSREVNDLRDLGSG